MQGVSGLSLILLAFCALLIGYVLLIACLSIPWLQRLYVIVIAVAIYFSDFESALYAHKIRTPTWWHNVYEPHVFGFASTFLGYNNCEQIPYMLKKTKLRHLEFSQPMV